MADCEWCGLFDAYLCPAHAEQRERELEAIAAGKLEGAAARRHATSESRSIASRWRLTLAEALEAEGKPRRGRPREDGYRGWLAAIGDKGRTQVAFLTLNFVSRSLLRPERQQPEAAETRLLASSVGQKLADRLFHDRGLREAYGDLPAAAYRRSIGTELIAVTAASTNLITLEDQQGGPRSRGKYIRPTELFLLEAQRHDRWVQPLYPPMVQEPHTWSQGQGGYRYDLAGQPELGADNAPAVVRAALDRLQITAWRINQPVLELVGCAFDESDAEKAAQVRHLLGLPDSPPDWAVVAGERWAVKRTAALRRVRDTLAVAEECLDPEARFHLPHHLDWRGRIYPAVELLNSQGGDLARALLLFAEGGSLGETGVRWLAIHGANCFGERGTLDQRVQWTKEHTQEIVEAAADPLGSERLANAKPKSRLQFYAFALEWARLQEHLKAGRAASDFVSSLPCGQDHTCSGVQHIAALLRSKKLARATNLLPGRPRDFYETVTKGVIRRLEAEAEDGVMQARMWLRGEQIITRDLIKQFAMTFEYGATSFGFGSDIGAYVEQEMDSNPELRAQEPMYRVDPADVFDFEPYPESMLNQPPPTAEELEEIKRRRDELRRIYGSAEDPRPEEDPELEAILDWAAEQHYWSERAKADNYLARITEDVMKQETKAREWFRGCAKAIAETNQPVSWTVPLTGFEVTQNGWYYMKKERASRPRAGGAQLVILKATEDVLPAKQANGLAPNVVHSLDAANLVLAINGLQEDTPLGTAHDCYFVRAADAELMNQTVRAAFVQLHSEPILDQLHAQFSALACQKLPKLRKGRLDVSDALDSEYMLS